MNTTISDEATTAKRDAFADGLHQLADWLSAADPAIPEPSIGVGTSVPIYFHNLDAYKRVLTGLGFNAALDGKQGGNDVWRSIELLHFGPVRVQLVCFERAPLTEPVRTLFGGAA